MEEINKTELGTKEALHNAEQYRRTITEEIEKRPLPNRAGCILERSSIFRYPKDLEALVSQSEKKIEAGEKIDLLEIGVGNMQELCSYLAAIKKVSDANGKELVDCLNTTIVELRPREEISPNFNLGKQLGFLLSEEQKKNAPAIKPPKDYVESFDYDKDTGTYKFSEDIREYIMNKINDQETAKFSTAIESYLETNSKEYDIVACNSVLPYLGAFGELYPNPLVNWDDQFSEFLSVLKKILKAVRKDGILIIHVDKKSGDTNGVGAQRVLELVPNFSADFTEIGPAIYRKN